jgi:hypothetical protein
VRDIHKYAARLVRLGECIFVHAGLVSRPQFQGRPGAQGRLVIANLGNIWGGAGVVHGIAQRVLHRANDGHLRNDSVLRGAAGTALVQHGEAREVAGGLVPGVGVHAGV